MIELFKAGTSHIVNGITCQKMIVNEFGFEHYLDDGWVFDPKDLYKEPEKPKESTLTDKVEDALEEVGEAQEALENVQQALEKKAADSQVKDLKPKASEKALKASKLGKTTKTAAKK
jgi:hypothetical protein